MDRLLPHGHVLRVLLQTIQWWVWLHPDAVVMVLRVASDIFSDWEKKRKKTKKYQWVGRNFILITIIILFHQQISGAYKYHHIHHICNGDMITVISIFNTGNKFYPIRTWCQGGESSSPWRRSGWACRRKLRWPDPVSAPDSVASSGYRGSSGADWLPLLSHSCPGATEAKNTTTEATVTQLVMKKKSVLWQSPGQ